MPELTLGEAKTFATVAVVVLIVLAVLSAWLMKEVTQKIAVAVILGLVALLVWTQRASLQECADRVRAAAVDTNGPDIDTTCRFLGRDIEIRQRRAS